MSVKEKLDKLIDWYEKNKPDSGQRIAVHAAPDTVKKFATIRDGKYFYRDRLIVPLRKKPERPGLTS